MPVIVATDEAGYGPKLGPLVIVASAWLIETNDDKADYRIDDAALQTMVEACIVERTLQDGTPLVIGDSKRLFQRSSSASLVPLERPIQAWLSDLFPSDFPGSLVSLLNQLAPLDFTELVSSPWFAKIESTFPETDSGQPNSGLVASSHARLISLEARVIDAKPFNALCEQCGNKATVLSEATVELARRAIEKADQNPACGQSPIFVFSDRQGGRQRYAGLLQQYFPDAIARVIGEQRACSRYSIDDPARSIDWRFSVKGDSFAPVAFSSMVAKYLRERLMHHFNDFWIRQHPGTLSPTAGYPVDADRFCERIQPTAERLKIKTTDYIRCR